MGFAACCFFRWQDVAPLESIQGESPWARCSAPSIACGGRRESRGKMCSNVIIGMLKCIFYRRDAADESRSGERRCLSRNGMSPIKVGPPVVPIDRISDFTVMQGSCASRDVVLSVVLLAGGIIPQARLRAFAGSGGRAIAGRWGWKGHLASFPAVDSAALTRAPAARTVCGARSPGIYWPRRHRERFPGRGPSAACGRSSGRCCPSGPA